MPEYHQTVDPAQAFEDLRAEVSALRKAIENVPIALERNRAPDYSCDLGILAEGLDSLTEQLDVMQKLPALRLTPEQHAHAIANAGSGLIREVVQKLDRAAQDTERERSRRASVIGTIRTKHHQRYWLAIVTVLALAVGFVAFPFVMRSMPFEINDASAAIVMNASRWDAGEAPMRSGNPDGWAQLTADANLANANRTKITACRDAAAKEKMEVRCTITVPAP